MLSSFRSIFFSFASYLLQAACGTTREFRRLYRLLLCSPDRRYPALVGSFLCSFYFSDDHTRDIFYRLPGLHYYKDAFGLALCRNSGACRIFRTMCEKKKKMWRWGWRGRHSSIGHGCSYVVLTVVLRRLRCTTSSANFGSTGCFRDVLCYWHPQRIVTAGRLNEIGQV